MHNHSLSEGMTLTLPICRKLIPVCFAFGMICGIVFAHCSDILASLMRQALFCQVSIVGLATVSILPFLLSAFAVLISCPVLLPVIVFSKAFLFGTCAAALDLTFGSAGWLVRMLLMFSDIASLPVLYWLWLRCSSLNPRGLLRDFLFALLVTGCIGGIDIWIIAPFLASVI